MTMGWIKNQSFSDYLEDEAIGSSGIVAVRRSPAHFKRGHNGPKKDTADWGTMVHTYLLEPKRFMNNAIDEPKEAWRGMRPKWQQHFDDCEEKGLLCMKVRDIMALPVAERSSGYREGVINVTPDQSFKLAGIMKSIKANGFENLLEGEKEHSGYAELSSGIKVKIRPDVKCAKEHRIVDVKTTQDCRAFNYDVGKYSYHIKAAWYLAIANMIEKKIPFCKFTWLVVETESPYACMKYSMEIGSEEYAVGHTQATHALAVYKACLDTGEYPGYSRSEQTLFLAERWRK